MSQDSIKCAARTLEQSSYLMFATNNGKIANRISRRTSRSRGKSVSTTTLTEQSA